jgi:hypothetical protein
MLLTFSNCGFCVYKKKIQLCSGIDENAVGACAQLVFAPVDVAISDDVPLLPSGFRVIPLDSNVCVIYFSSNIFSTQLTTWKTSVLNRKPERADGSANLLGFRVYGIKQIKSRAFQHL